MLGEGAGVGSAFAASSSARSSSEDVPSSRYATGLPFTHPILIGAAGQLLVRLLPARAAPPLFGLGSALRSAPGRDARAVPAPGAAPAPRVRGAGLRPRGFVSLAGCLSHVSAAFFFRDPEICGESLAELVVGRGSRMASCGSLAPLVAHGDSVGERAARARGSVEDESSEDACRLGAGIARELEPRTPTKTDSN